MKEIKNVLVNLYEHLHYKLEIFPIRIKYSFNIMNGEDTLKYILMHKCSIARFGDGEFDLMFNERNIGFQDKSLDLQNRLQVAMANNNLLRCICGSLNSTKGLKADAKRFWKHWGKNGHQRKVYELVVKLAGRNCVFGDAQITRPYIDYKTYKNAKKIFPMLKQLWNNQDILIVEGSQSRLGVGNDLFNNAKSIKRILAPPINAFSIYDKILETVIQEYNGELVILALGPVATILASDLSNINIQALDLGHIDIEYEWFLRGAKEKIGIQGKFVNENKDYEHEIADCTDPKYLAQIVVNLNK